MADPDPRRRALFEDLAGISEEIASSAVEYLRNGPPEWLEQDVREAFAALQLALNTPELQAAYKKALTEQMWVLLHSVFVAIEGGTEAAETVSLELADDDGVPLGPGLNEWFMTHLLETGRKR